MTDFRVGELVYVRVHGVMRIATVCSIRNANDCTHVPSNTMRVYYAITLEGSVVGPLFAGEVMTIERAMAVKRFEDRSRTSFVTFVGGPTMCGGGHSWVNVGRWWRYLRSWCA